MLCPWPDFKIIVLSSRIGNFLTQNNRRTRILRWPGQTKKWGEWGSEETLLWLTFLPSGKIGWIIRFFSSKFVIFVKCFKNSTGNAGQLSLCYWNIKKSELSMKKIPGQGNPHDKPELWRIWASPKMI